MNKKHKAITTLRQLVPAAFVLYLILALVSIVLFPSFAIYSLSGFILYVLAAFFMAVKSSSSPMVIIYLVFSFFTLHSSYGLGYLKGIINFLILGKKPAK